MEINDKIRQQLCSWTDVLAPFLQSSEFDKIISTLKQLTQSGKEVFPKSTELFKSFELCDRQKLRAVILLQCPYATLRDGVMISDGIPMNCKNIAPYQQPSLYQFHTALDKCYGFDPDTEQRCDISYLLSEEHVLLVNSALTVENGKVDSHSQLWEPFTRFLLEEVIGKLTCGIPIVLMGTQAQRYEKYVNPMCHHVLKVEHPASASYQNREWNYGDMFEFCNRILIANNGEKIDWMRKKGQGKKELVSYPSWVTDTLPTAQSLGLPWKD